MNAQPTLTTRRTDAALSAVAVRRTVHYLNPASDVWEYVLSDARTVNLVVSRRGGRIVRAFTTTPTDAITRYTGGVRAIAARLLAFVG